MRGWGESAEILGQKACEMTFSSLTPNKHKCHFTMRYDMGQCENEKKSEKRGMSHLYKCYFTMYQPPVLEVINIPIKKKIKNRSICQK